MSYYFIRLYCSCSVFLLLLMTGIKDTRAQNLVINPGFEDTLQCPYFVSQIDFAVNWHTSVNTPDYYHACNNTGQVNPGIVGVPNSARGYQPARTGDAFAGVVIYWTAQANYREIFYAQLQSPLVAGVEYSVGMYVVMNEDNAMWAVDGGLGIYLSSTPINPSTPFAYTPQISNPSGNVLNDTLNWTAISGIYTAAGGEQFITIGSFIPDNMLTIVNRGGTYPFTSYAIEDVWVLRDSITTGINPANQIRETKVFPNPFEDNLGIEVPDNTPSEVILYDITSRKMLHQEFTNSVSLNTEAFDSGVYYYEVRNNKGIIKKGKAVKQ
jgi:hypothetical protein